MGFSFNPEKLIMEWRERSDRGITMGGFSGGGGARGPRPPLFSCIFEKFLTLSLTFGHKCSQNDVKQHHQFLRPPLSGFSASVSPKRFNAIISYQMNKGIILV